MPVIYLPKELYDRLIRMGEDPPVYVIKATQEKLAKGNGTTSAPKEG